MSLFGLGTRSLRSLETLIYADNIYTMGKVARKILSVGTSTKGVQTIMSPTLHGHRHGYSCS